MSDSKKRDVPKELVDFLLKGKEKEDGSAESESTQNSQKATRMLEPDVPKALEIEIDIGEEQEGSLITPEGTVVPPVPDEVTSVQEEDHATEQVQKSEPTRVAVKRARKSKPPVEEERREEPKLSKKAHTIKFGLPTEISSPEKTRNTGADFGKSIKQDRQGSVSHPSFPSQRGESIFNEVSSLVGGTEAVRVAQARIHALEKERDQLRDEVEKLLITSENLKRRLDESKAEGDSFERKYRQKIEILQEEKAVVRGRLDAREQESRRLTKENEELQSRFQGDLRRVRVRERELESRYELLKAETSAVVRTKDELIIELRRQLEQLSFELDNFRAKSADLNSKVSEFHERNHRTVKALRLALTVLEMGDGEEKPTKKAVG